MTQNDQVLVRAFDGSLVDARGLLAVERATFDESPYSARQIQDLLTGGSQHAWVAVDGDRIVGFALAFATHGLSGPCWEMDLLAVHPDWRGRGIATRLIRAVAAGSPDQARRARAVVATDNGASNRAFARAGFRRAPEVCTLLTYRPADAALRPRLDDDVQVHEAANSAEAARWLGEFHQQTSAAGNGQADRKAPTAVLPPSSAVPRISLLLATQNEQPAGYAELIEVQTLLYRGAWIESLIAPSRVAREALIEQALRRGLAAGWDEIGAMVPRQNWPVRNVLLAQGFRSLGEFRWQLAALPLPGTVPPRQSGRTEGNVPGSGHA